MKTIYTERFSSGLKSVAEAREPFRSALQRELPAQDSARLLIYTPADESFKGRSPASVLAVTNDGWIVVAESKEGETTITRSDFAHTLFVELTIILLYGAMRIDFVVGGYAESVQIRFNTVMEDLYRDAVQVLLDGIDGVTMPTPVDRKEIDPIVNPLPLKFCNAVLGFAPAGRRLLAVTHWPAAMGGRYRWFERELAPEAALVLADRELLVISEQKSWSWLRRGRPTKFGNIIDFCPLSRLITFQITEHNACDSCDLDVRTPDGGEKITFGFPHNQQNTVLQFMKRVVEQQFNEPSIGGTLRPQRMPHVA